MTTSPRSTPPSRPDGEPGLRETGANNLASRFRALGAQAQLNAQAIRGSADEINSALGGIVGTGEETPVTPDTPAAPEAGATPAEGEGETLTEEETPEDAPAPAPFAGIEDVANSVSDRSGRVIEATTEAMNAMDDGARAIIRTAETEEYAAAMANHIASVPGAAPEGMEVPAPAAEPVVEATPVAAAAPAPAAAAPVAAAPAAPEAPAERPEFNFEEIDEEDRVPE